MRNVSVPDNAIVIVLTCRQHNILWQWIKAAKNVCDTLPYMKTLPREIIAKIED